MSAAAIDERQSFLLPHSIRISKDSRGGMPPTPTCNRPSLLSPPPWRACIVVVARRLLLIQFPHISWIVANDCVYLSIFPSWCRRCSDTVCMCIISNNSPHKSTPPPLWFSSFFAFRRPKLNWFLLAAVSYINFGRAPLTRVNLKSRVPRSRPDKCYQRVE